MNALRFNRSDYAMLVLASLLMFVWSLPDMIALRIGLAVLLLSLGLWKSRGPAWPDIRRAFQASRTVWGLYLLLTAWIIVQALLFAIHRDVALKEIWGQWVRSGLTGLAGFLLAAHILRNRPHRGGPVLMLTMALVLASQVIIHDADTLWRWWHEGQFPFQQTRLVHNRSFLSFVTNLLLGFLCAETMARLLYRHRYLPIRNRWLGVLFLACFFATYALGTRNGTLGVLGLLISSAIVLLIGKRKEIHWVRLVCIALLAGSVISWFGWITFKSDARWNNFLATIPVALDTEHQDAWKNPDLPFPQLPNGSTAEESAYLRLAWGKEAIKAIVHNPLGVGFGRGAFGQAVLQEHPDYTSTIHSHSGILDFTVGVGFPGLILWLAFIGALAIKGWHAFFRSQNPAGLLLLFLVTGYCARGVVDSNIRDHMLEQFMFLALLVAMLTTEDERAAQPA